MPDRVQHVFEKAVSEGRRRLDRTWGDLLATGAVGGIDIGVGLLAFLVVRHLTGSHLFGALAFGTGFIALTLAHSELFTENFLVPIAPVVAGQVGWTRVVRLWAGTAVTNLSAGWLFTALIVTGMPQLVEVEREVGHFYLEQALGWRSMSLALIGGAIITLMTWMERGTTETGAKLVAAYMTGFLLLVGPVNHSIVGSLEIFAALQAGLPGFGYLDWLGWVGWVALGNMIGGLTLVTLLRLLQVGAETLQEARQESAEAGRREAAAREEMANWEEPV